MSTTTHVLDSVPQGSVLSPLLFSIEIPSQNIALTIYMLMIFKPIQMDILELDFVKIKKLHLFKTNALDNILIIQKIIILWCQFNVQCNIFT